MTVWLIADAHLDHGNIIGYCHRPFRSVYEMNRTIVRNWNTVVNPDDCIIVVGDLCFRRFTHWDLMLNGHKILIRGNHDKRGLRSLIIRARGYRLLLIHNPADVRQWNGGWIIHGHRHNHGSFVDPNQRTINVSVEHLGYKPISLEGIIDIITKHELSRHTTS